MDRINILGVNFDAITFGQALATLKGYLRTDYNHIVVTPNPEGVMQARRNAKFMKALKEASLSLADGIGIAIAAKIKRLKLPGRVRGVDITMALFKSLSAEGASVYLLGAAPGVAERAAKNIETVYKGVKVVGYHHGFFDSDEKIVADINRLSPDIVLVGIGMPRQELWAAKNRCINTRITMCVGGTIDILAGEVQLAPAFMRSIGLEWLYRLIRQPSRAKRMLDLPRFMIAVLFRR